MNNNINTATINKRRFASSAEVVKDVSVFAAHIAMKYSGYPLMLEAARSMFDALITATIKIEQGKRINTLTNSVDNKP